MRPTDQTRYGERGNCFSACIASLLEIPIEIVPNFISERHDVPQSALLNQWLAPLNLHALYCETDIMHPEHAVPDGFYILTGTSPRGRLHVVIAAGKEIVHDPHPSRAGLTEVDGFVVILPL